MTFLHLFYKYNFEFCVAGLSIDRSLYHGACLLSEVHMKLLNYTEAQKCAEAALNLNPSNSKTALMFLIKPLAFSDQPDNWKRVVELSRVSTNLFHFVIFLKSGNLKFTFFILNGISLHITF